MKYFLMIPCLILCSCFSEEEEPENQLLDPTSSSSAYLASSSSVEPDTLTLLNCPPEDIAEYPVLEPISQPPEFDGMEGWCQPPKLSVEKLSFGKQGGIRCITSTPGILSADARGCTSRTIIVSDTVNNPPHFFGVTRFKKLICPWFTATAVDAETNRRTLHISVNQNEMEIERESRVIISIGNCATSFTITQSAE